MHEVLNDPVDVVVAFSDNRVRPKKIRWDGREYKIKQVNLIHTASEGAKRLFFFSVSDDTNFFKLRLDTETLDWRLVELYTE